MPKNMHDRLAFLLETLEVAGNIALRHFRNEIGYELKPDQTPLTIADSETERFVRAAIRNRYPSDAILGEEEGQEGRNAQRWVIDPIDGTKSFVCGVPLWGCLLSFEEEEGVATCAGMFFPALGDMLYATTGGGAFCNGRPIRVSTRSSLDGAVVACAGHQGMQKTGYDKPFAEKIAPRLMASRTWCDCYGHALVARGKIVAMIDPRVQPYDLSAPTLIVREAGGRCTTFDGTEHPQFEAVSSNGLVHNELLAALRR